MLSQDTLALAKKTQDAWAQAAMTKGVEPGDFVILQRGLVIHLPTESPCVQSIETLGIVRKNLPSLFQFAKAGDWRLYSVGLRQHAILWLASICLYLNKAEDWKNVQEINAKARTGAS